MSSRPRLLRPEVVLVLSAIGDALTTLYAINHGLPEASPITRAGLQLLGPAYFALQFLILLALVKINMRVSFWAGYVIPLTQWFAAWHNLGIIRVMLWSQ